MNTLKKELLEQIVLLAGDKLNQINKDYTIKEVADLIATIVKGYGATYEKRVTYMSSMKKVVSWRNIRNVMDFDYLNIGIELFLRAHFPEYTINWKSGMYGTGPVSLILKPRNNGLNPFFIRAMFQTSHGVHKYPKWTPK